MALFPACTVPRCKGRMLKTYAEKRLHNQLLFYKSLFDVKWAHGKIEADNKRRTEKLSPSVLSADEMRTLGQLCAQAEEALGTSAYHVVDFGRLLTGCAPCSPGGEVV